MMKYRLTAIFRGCGQTGVHTWQDYALTREIKLADEQLNKLIKPPAGTQLAELIFEQCEEGEEG